MSPPGNGAWTVLSTAATLLWAFAVCFLLLHAMPGDPADRLDSPRIPPEQAARTRQALGLDEPVPLQFARTLGSYAQGDLGDSITRRRPVTAVLSAALPPTLLLGVAALLIAYGTGLPLALGLVRLPPAVRRRLDRLLVAVATLPRFWLAVLLILLLHGVAGWLPASHAQSPGGGDWLDRLRHLVLPALALGLPAACIIARYQLAAMERALEQPHVRAARAAGSAGSRLLVQHVLRPSAGTALALFGLDLPVIVSGAIVVEVVFAWPGVGRLAADAVLQSDYPLALACAVLSAGVVVLGRLVTEGLARRLDPRRALASGGPE